METNRVSCERLYDGEVWYSHNNTTNEYQQDDDDDDDDDAWDRVIGTR